jgi:hypothetical protein
MRKVMLRDSNIFAFDFEVRSFFKLLWFTANVEAIH